MAATTHGHDLARASAITGAALVWAAQVNTASVASMVANVLDDVLPAVPVLTVRLKAALTAGLVEPRSPHRLAALARDRTAVSTLAAAIYAVPSTNRLRCNRTAQSRNSASHPLGCSAVNRSPMLDQHPPGDSGRFSWPVSAPGGTVELVSEWEEVLGGGGGPWLRLVPAAWQAAALPGAPAPQLRRLEPNVMAGMRPQKRHEAEISYWSALVHLLSAGLGWTRVDLGLQRWMGAGMPAEDPVLAAVARGWGPHLEEFLGWLCQENRASHWATVLDPGGTRRQLTDPVPGLPLRVPNPEAYTWHHMGADALHLTNVGLWLNEPPNRGNRLLRDERVGPGGRVLIAPTYTGWRAALDLIPPRTADGRSVRVEVWCQSIGWLGVYRRSRESGGWFRGRHRWHVLGA